MGGGMGDQGPIGGAGRAPPAAAMTVGRLHSHGDGSAMDSLLPSHPNTPLHVRLAAVPVDDDKTAFYV
jgi:hypothetical protein